MGISAIANTILAGINCIQEIFYWFYRISLFLGYCIVLIVLHIYDVCVAVVSSICDIVKILNDDFDLFISDIGNILLLVWAYINDAFSKSINTVLQVNNRVNSFSNNIFLAFISLFETDVYQSITLNCIYKPLELIFGALCLIGHSACYITKTLLEFIENIPKLPQLALSNVKKRSVNLGHYILCILTHEAMYGFLIVSGLTYISYKSRLCHKFGYTCHKMFSSICMIAFNYLRTFISLVCISIPRLKIRFWKRRTSNYFSATYNRDELEKLLEKEKAEKMCIICMDNKRNSMLLNCKHLVLCNDCAYTILDYQRMCPVCRSYVSQVIPVYT